MAALDARYPPNSLEGIAACLDASADIVEVDITALQSGDYLLVHDPELASETTGHGQVERCTAADVASLRITWNGLATTFRVPTLSQVVGEFLRPVGSRSKLQLD